MAKEQHLTVENSTKQPPPWIKNGTQSCYVFRIIVVYYGIGHWTFKFSAQGPHLNSGPPVSTMLVCKGPIMGLSCHEHEVGWCVSNASRVKNLAWVHLKECEHAYFLDSDEWKHVCLNLGWVKGLLSQSSNRSSNPSMVLQWLQRYGQCSAFHNNDRSHKWTLPIICVPWPVLVFSMIISFNPLP